ncbi:MAG: T9SS type A sorting domain-containing protein, partial [Candidatus Paceibacterota bacterium]
FRLFQNYPNPFYPISTIRYDIPVDQHVRIDLYTITGQFVRTLVNRQDSAGRHSVTIDATTLSSGVYIYRLTSEDFSDSVKMSVIK